MSTEHQLCQDPLLGGDQRWRKSINHWQCVLNKQINLAQRLGLSLKRVDAAAVTEQTQSSSEASNPSNCFSHHLGPGVGPGPALHSAETKQKAQRNGRWSRYCLSVEWKRTKRKSGFTAASGAHSEAGQISGIFSPPRLSSPESIYFAGSLGFWGTRSLWKWAEREGTTSILQEKLSAREWLL